MYGGIMRHPDLRKLLVQNPAAGLPETSLLSVIFPFWKTPDHFSTYLRRVSVVASLFPGYPEFGIQNF